MIIEILLALCLLGAAVVFVLPDDYAPTGAPSRQSASRISIITQNHPPSRPRTTNSATKPNERSAA